jgi:hypothetical protein
MWMKIKANCPEEDKKKIVVNIEKPVIMKDIDMTKSKIKIKQKPSSEESSSSEEPHQILTWLKRAVDELAMGVKVEAEHAPTVAKIQGSIKDGKITMSDEDIYKSIAEDHLNEFSDYYTKLAKMESEAKQSKEVK